MGSAAEIPYSFDPSEFIETFEAVTMDAERIQRETLKRILEENRGAEYLQKCGLGEKTDPESFKACVPLVTHEDLEPYIQRIADGDDSPILTAKPFTTMSLSTGTSGGRPKFVPFNNALMEHYIQIAKTSYCFRSREFPIGKGKSLYLIYGAKHDEFKTKGGLPARPATINVYHHPLFKKAMQAMQTPCCSPDEVVFGPDFHQSLYCHLLCGLLFREEIQVVSSSFAHSIVEAFRLFEQVWEELCTDIRTGVLSSRISVPAIRTAMSRLLVQPNPELADLIAAKCRGLSNFSGLISDLFPNIKYIYGIMTGSMEPYLKKLRHYAGEVPLINADYGASEGLVGANVNPRLPPEQVAFAVLPDIGYFEFLPVYDHGSPFSETFGLTQVEVGKEYEVVLTTFAGMYRYRVGDVVKVKGFHNSTPEVQFICRRNLVLTINVEKTTEKDLQLSVKAAAEVLAEEKVEVVDFTSTVDPTSDPAHYVVFWEISGEASNGILQKCCNYLDLSFKDPAYQYAREVKSIGALELRILKIGAFHKILEHSVGLGAAASQFKTPRCVAAANTSLLQILSDNVVNNFFSTAF